MLYGDDFYPGYLIDRIIWAIRGKVGKSRGQWFDGGAIVVRLVPKSASAMAAFTHQTGKPEKEFSRVCPIFEGASTYIVDNGKSLDCIQIAGQKIAACAAADEMGFSMASGEWPLDEKKYPHPDFAPWKGGLGYDVRLLNPDGKSESQWHVFVAVSGSTEEHDQICAEEAYIVVQNFFGQLSKDLYVTDPMWRIRGTV